MAHGRNKIIYITDTYPFDVGEATFIKPELEQMCKTHEVVIVSCGRGVENCDEEFLYNKGIVVYHFHKPSIGLFERIMSILRVLTEKAMWADARIIVSEHKLLFKRLKASFWFVQEALLFKKWLEKQKLLSNENIYSTYWYYSHTLSLVLLKKEKRITKVITRAHGYDIHGDRLYSKRECCKRYMDKWLDAIVFIAEEGRDYYLKQNSISMDERHNIYYLGAPKANVDFENLLNDNRTDVFTIVSCSSIIPLKRVGLIIDALSLITDYDIQWTHFGDGNISADIHELAKIKLNDKSNIKYRFEGYVDRRKIYEYYSLNESNCFMLLSSTEGLPVSIMEALAHGIPIITTDVGGCYETWNRNGVLLSANPSLEEIKAAIEMIINASTSEYISMRTNSYDLWREKFDVKNNMEKYNCFVDNLFGLNE